MKRRAADEPSDGPASPGKALVVWDFDWSLINENSDTYVIEELDTSGEVMDAVEGKEGAGEGWTALMDWAVGELHARGHAPQALREALSNVPVLSGALEAVAAAQEAGAEQRILSDANDVYIATVLQARGLEGAFAHVETNPAEFDDADRLHIRPPQPADTPHDCPLCPPNLCKGAVIERWLDELKPTRCVYVGDGGGDFCPATRLRVGDTLCARQAPHNALLRKCRKEPSRVRARVVEWGGSKDAAGAALREGVAQGVIL